jgi:hypothetical protein
MLKGSSCYSKVAITGETLGFAGNDALLARPLPLQGKVCPERDDLYRMVGKGHFSFCYQKV